jgi:hypothetical protein
MTSDEFLDVLILGVGASLMFPLCYRAYVCGLTGVVFGIVSSVYIYRGYLTVLSSELVTSSPLMDVIENKPNRCRRLRAKVY